MEAATKTQHVMFVISSLERGGAEYQLVAIAAGLSARGWRVTVLSFLPFSSTSWRSELQGTDIRLLTLNASSGLLRYASLIHAARVIKRQKPDVLVGFMYHGILTARLAGRLARIPANVSSIHSDRNSTFREIVMRVTDRLTDAITVLSSHLASELEGRRIAVRSRIHVIPNSVDVTRLDSGVRRDQTREQLGVTDDQFLWLAVGRLDHAKDYPNLLNAFSDVSGRHPNVRLVVAGEGPLKGELHSMIQRLQIDDCVRLLGLRLDMPALYAASDALVLSSAWEGMPNVVLEAMASKRPVVATSVGAVPEVVADGESGLIVPPRDQRALSSAMARVIKLPEETREAFGRAGYDRVVSEFSRDSVIDKWEDLFNQLLACKS